MSAITLKVKVDQDVIARTVAQEVVYLSKQLGVYIKFKWRGKSYIVAPWDRVDTVEWDLTLDTR